MTSTTSSKNKFLSVLKNIFVRNIGAFIFLQLFSLITTFVLIKNIVDISKLKTTQSFLNITNEATFTVSIMLMFVSIIVSFFVVINSYREIFSKHASDFYFSLPVKRETYFNASFVSSLITIVVYYSLSVLLTLVVLKTNLVFDVNNFILFDFSKFFRTMLVCLVISVFALSVFSFCAVLSGRVFHYFLFCLATLFVFLFGAISVVSYINNIWGLHIDVSYGSLISPYGASLLISNTSRPNNLIIAAVSLVLAVVYYVLGLIVFKKRKAEIAESLVAGKIIPSVILTVTLISTFMLNMSAEHNSEILFVILSIIYTFILSVICSFIFSKKALTKTSLISFAVSTAVSVVLIICVNFLPNISYVKYVPNESEVQSVTISDYDGGEDIGDIDFYSNLFFRYFVEGIGKESTPVVIEDENIANVIKMHQKIVDDKDIRNNKTLNSQYQPLNLKLEYKLKNGKTVKRCYSLDSQYILDEYVEILTNDDALNQKEPFKLNSDDVLLVTYENSNYTVDVSQDKDLNRQSIKIVGDFDDLKSAIKEDLKQSPFQLFELYNYKVYSDYEDYVPAGVINFYAVNENATTEDKAKLKSMTKDEIISCFREESKENKELIEKTQLFYFQVYENNKNVIKFLN